MEPVRLRSTLAYGVPKALEPSTIYDSASKMLLWSRLGRRMERSSFGTALLISVFFCHCAFPQASNLTVGAVTPQQALIQYDAPDTLPCTLSATSGGTLQDIVWDLSEVEFPGSTSDLARSSTIVSSGGRQVEIGLRAAQLGRSGKLRSRSLQANTPYSLTVACTGGSSIVNFTTLNIPVGNTVPDPPAFNNAGFGNAAWPNLDWTDKNAVYVDPKTGLALRPATWFGRIAFKSYGMNFGAYFDSAGTWSNASNIISGRATSFATSNASDPIFVAINAATPGPGSSSFAGYTVTDLRVNFTGSGGPINFCLTADSGQSCISAVQTATLPPTAGTVSFPSSNFPSPPFSEWGIQTMPQHNIVVPFVTQVTTASIPGSTATLVANQTPVPSSTGLFPVNLSSGSKVMVQNSSCPNQLCTVAQVQNSASLLLEETLAPAKNLTLTSANFGLKIWSVSSSNPVVLTSTYDLIYEPAQSFLIADGASDQCSPNIFNITEDAAGKSIVPTPAYLCVVDTGSSDGHSLHVFIPSTGEMRQVGLTITGYSGDDGDHFYNTSSPALPFSPWDVSDPRTLYGIANTGANKPGIAKWVYRGNGRAYFPGPLTQGGLYYQDAATSDGESKCNSGESQWANLCVSVVNKASQGHDLYAMLATSSAAAKAQIFGSFPRPIAVIGNTMALYWQRQQDGLTAYSYINLQTGAQTAYADTLGGSGVRWGGAHTSSAWVVGTRHMALINPLGSRGNSGPSAGPYKTSVVQVWRDDSSNWDNNTQLAPTYAYNCPVNTLGAFGQNCVQIRISGMPCSEAADTIEVAFSSCPWNAKYAMPSPLQIGDLIGNLSYQGSGAGSETMRVLSITQNSPTDIVLWLQRYANASSQSPSEFPNGWSLSPYPTAPSSSSSWWFDSAGSNTVFTDDPHITAHIDVVSAPEGYSITSAYWAKYNAPASQVGFSELANSMQIWGVWAGLQGPAPGGNSPWPGNGLVELYPSCRQVKAPSPEHVWCADWRAYQGGSFTGQNAGTTQAGTISITPVASNSIVFKFSLSGATSNPKQVPIENWGGRFLYREKSGPRVLLTNADNGAFCRVYIAGECVPRSSPGDIYFASSSAIVNQTSCFTNHMEAELPCFFQANPLGTWAVQEDISEADTVGNRVRRLTMGFEAPGRPGTATNWRPTPDGLWGLFPSPWMDGFSPVLWVGRIPSWPGYDNVNRDDYVMAQMQLGPGSTLAEIRFGYEEYGTRLLGNPVHRPGRMPPDAEFYCTSRQDQCVTNASAKPSTNKGPGNPFNWVVSEGHNGIACAGGCSISIPGLSGRILWWQEFRSSDGVNWSSVGTPQRFAVP